MLELLREKYHDTVRKRMAIIHLHISLDSILKGKLLKSYFELNFIPEDYGRQVVIVFRCVHIPLSGIVFNFFLKLCDVFRVHNLIQFFCTISPKFLQINQGLSFLLN